MGKGWRSKYSGRDALGNDLYDIETMSDGYTPWFALPSDFHLDFRGLGGGNNPDGFADDEYEDSCSDGIDNDGDLLLDSDDDDCDHSAGTRNFPCIGTLHTSSDLDWTVANSH